MLILTEMDTRTSSLESPITIHPYERLQTQFNNGSGGFLAASNLAQPLATPSSFAGSTLGARSIVASSPASATAFASTIDFNGLSLSLGDRVTITVPGGTSVSAVMDANGLNTLLTSLGNSLAAQSSLFSGASNSGGTLTINGLADGSAMPSLSVTLEDGVDTSRFDFNNKNLVEGDQVVIKVTGGTDVQRDNRQQRPRYITWHSCNSTPVAKLPIQ